MPTIMTHAAVPLALGLGLGARVISHRLLAAGVVASMLPDLDVLAFRLGIPYADQFGHRGFSHSLLLAIMLAIIGSLMSERLKSSRPVTFAFVLLATASHGLLDMLTNGGLGIAYFWPFSAERYFFPVQVIQVSPLSIHRVFSQSGLSLFATEFRWVWLPAIAVFIGLRFARKPASA